MTNGINYVDAFSFFPYICFFPLSDFFLVVSLLISFFFWYVYFMCFKIIWKLYGIFYCIFHLARHINRYCYLSAERNEAQFTVCPRHFEFTNKYIHIKIEWIFQLLFSTLILYTTSISFKKSETCRTKRRFGMPTLCILKILDQDVIHRILRVE